jgi:hypothetical protein
MPASDNIGPSRSPDSPSQPDSVLNVYIPPLRVSTSLLSHLAASLAT